MNATLDRELLIYTISRLLQGVRHVAVGASSPMPAAGAMLLRALEEKRGAPPVRISILGSVKHNFLPTAAWSSSIALPRAVSMPSSWEAARSMGRATSISSEQAIIRVQACGGLDPLAPPISISWFLASSFFAKNTHQGCSLTRSTSSVRQASATAPHTEPEAPSRY